MEDEAQEETFMSDYEQGKLLKGISNWSYAAQSELESLGLMPKTSIS